MLHAPVATNHRPPTTRTVRPPEPQRSLHPLGETAARHFNVASAGVAALHRKCDCGGAPDCDCDTGPKKHEGGLHRLADGSAERHASQAPPIVHDVLRSPGQPLDSDTLAFFESRFGRDLSGVRVHTDSRAAESARAVHALGYTVGQHIAFAGGQYQPGSESGRRLLAHELAHTAQQQANVAWDSRSLVVAPATGPNERIADRMAGDALRGSLTESAGSGFHRTGAGSSPALARALSGPLLQRQTQVTCSVDVVKIARAKAGDKVAAAEILNCCQSGLSPLPAGCTADLIDALSKILGKKPEDKTKCPVGFHGAKSEKFKGQCCKDSAAGEGAQDCCPPERITPLFGTCCPPGQIAQGNRCVPAGSLQPR